VFSATWHLVRRARGGNHGQPTGLTSSIQDHGLPATSGGSGRSTYGTVVVVGCGDPATTWRCRHRRGPQLAPATERKPNPSWSTVESDEVAVF